MSVREGLLVLLANGPRHGYQLRREYESAVGSALNIGQVYTTLGRLERDGLVAETGADGEERRREYTLTPDGIDTARAWLLLADPATADVSGIDVDEVVARVMLASVSDAAALAEVLDRARRSVIDELARLRSAQRTTTAVRTGLQLDADGLRLEALARWLDRVDARSDDLLSEGIDDGPS